MVSGGACATTKVTMLEWMIAIAAVCGAISGLAIVYLALRAALQTRKGSAARRAMAVPHVDAVDDDGDSTLPHARVHRVSPTLGLRRLRSLRRKRHSA